MIPDAAIARAGTTDPMCLAPADVLLTVEVVSPSSRTMDTVTKPAARAERGVPAYLAVTLVPGGRASLTWRGEASDLIWTVEAPETADL